MELLVNIFNESASLWLSIAPYLLLGMLFAGLLHVFLGTDFVTRHLGGGTFGSILKATLFGIPLPICSCGVIPVAALLRKEGASQSATLSFLVSTPTTGVDSILATYSLMGPLFAIFRPVAAFISGITIGAIDRLFNPGEKIRRSAHHHTSLSVQFKLKEIFRYGFFELAEDIGKWLIIGVIIGAVLTVVIPEALLINHFSNPFLHFLVILLFALPLYVCATGSIPIAAALIQKGFSPGAALIFLIAGPATNTVTLSFVRSRLGKRAFIVYLSSIIAVSFLLGWLFQFLWLKLGGGFSMISPHGGHLPLWLRIGSGIILLVIILQGFVKAKGKSIKMKYELFVPDMICKHCQMTVKKKIEELSGITQVVVNFDEKKVGVDGHVNLQQIEQAIREAGYTPKEVSR
ncbi:permease [bacterium]|nr:permease [bacterium]